MQLFPPNTAYLETWQDQRAEAKRETDPFRIILVAYTLLLLIVSVAVIAILIGARAITQQREMSLLRAIGLSPRQVSALFVLEVGVLGVIGIVLGFVPGTLLAPRLAAPAASTLLGSPETTANPIAHACGRRGRPARHDLGVIRGGADEARRQRCCTVCARGWSPTHRPLASCG